MAAQKIPIGEIHKFQVTYFDPDWHVTCTTCNLLLSVNEEGAKSLQKHVTTVKANKLLKQLDRMWEVLN